MAEAAGAGRDGLVALTTAGVSSGALSAFDVLVPVAAAAPVAAEVAALPGVRTVLAPDGAAWRSDGTALLTVVPETETGLPDGERTLREVVSTIGDRGQVGGSAAQLADYLDNTYAAFGGVLAIIAVITYVVLARAFRSLLLPLKAVLVNLLSLAAVLGAMVVLWQWGWGTEAVLGIPPTGTLGTFVPITIFAFLYGISMDYEVFLLARMREEYDGTGDTARAVVAGLGRTGRLVTGAALILFLPFAAMAASTEHDVAVFATGLALGVLIDATVIRAVLVPALVAMMGDLNWWLPRWAARLLRVAPSPRPDRHGPSAPSSP